MRRQIRGLNVASPLQTDQAFNTSMPTASVQPSNRLDLSFLTLQEPRCIHKLISRQTLQINKLIIIVRIVRCVCMCNSRVQVLTFPFSTTSRVSGQLVKIRIKIKTMISDRRRSRNNEFRTPQRPFSDYTLTTYTHTLSSDMKNKTGRSSSKQYLTS